MANYNMEITRSVDTNGETYWSVAFPDVSGVVGGGKSIAEAVKDAKENLKAFVELNK